MSKKRKSDATKLDESDRTIYSTFCAAANSLSQLYTHAMNHQKLSFQAGQRFALEKFYQWVLRQQELGSRISAMEILSHLQDEMEYGGEEGYHLQSQNILPPVFAPALPDQSHQSKNPVFSNALSSPVRRGLLQQQQQQQQCNSTVGGQGSNPSESCCCMDEESHFSH